MPGVISWEILQSEYDYCSVCYQVPGYVVQQASGQTYAQFLQQNIFDPLQMRATSFSSSAYYANAHHATGYASWQAPAENDGWDDIDMTSSWSFLFGSGVLTTTTGGLYLWDQGLNAHKILSQQSLGHMNHPTGVHAFDMLNDDARSREIIRATLEFLKTHLLIDA